MTRLTPAHKPGCDCDRCLRESIPESPVVAVPKASPPPLTDEQLARIEAARLEYVASIKDLTDAARRSAKHPDMISASPPESPRAATEGGEGRSVQDLMPPTYETNEIAGPGSWCRASDVRAALSRALGASPQMPEELDAALRSLAELDDLCATDAAEARGLDVAYELRERAWNVVAAYRAEKGASQ